MINWKKHILLYILLSLSSSIISQGFKLVDPLKEAEFNKLIDSATKIEILKPSSINRTIGNSIVRELKLKRTSATTLEINIPNQPSQASTGLLQLELTIGGQKSYLKDLATAKSYEIYSPQLGDYYQTIQVFNPSDCPIHIKSTFFPNKGLGVIKGKDSFNIKVPAGITSNNVDLLNQWFEFQWDESAANCRGPKTKPKFVNLKDITFVE